MVLIPRDWDLGGERQAAGCMGELGVGKISNPLLATKSISVSLLNCC